MPIRHRLSRLLDGAIHLTTILGGLAVVLMMLHIVVDVLLRYFFASPLPGTITIVSSYYMVLATFLPLAYAEKLGAHISVDFVYGFMPPWLQILSLGVGLVVTTIVLTLITWRSWQVAVDGYHIGAKVIQGGSVVQVWPGYFLAPFGMALALILLLTKFARLVMDPKAFLQKESAHD